MSQINESDVTGVSSNIVYTGFFDVDDSLVLHAEEVRKQCEANTCGYYGANWMCPPAVGDVCTCGKTITSFKRMCLFKTEFVLDDWMDIESIMGSMRSHQDVVRSVKDLFGEEHGTVMGLSAGACMNCTMCSCMEGSPCRFPDMVVPSIEAYGVDLFGFCSENGIRYGCDDGRLAYFGMVLYDRKP